MAIRALRGEITDKSVLFVPIFSARSYETGIYNLALDGNMARIVSMILMGKPRKATVLVPMKIINLDIVSRQLKGIDVNFVRCGAYGENAYATRMNGEAFANFMNLVFDPNDFDVLVLEPNTLLLSNDLFIFKNARIIYWCVASVTSKGIPWFTEKFVDIDKEIASKFPTECVLQTQVDALGGLSYADGKGFYDVSQFDYDTIFFPFRLTDQNYHADDVKKAVQKLKKDGCRNFKVLYTDVNDSGRFYEDPDTFIKIPSQKEVYIGILKSKPIIPYLENTDVLTHINIHEMMYYGCRLIMFENDTYKGYDNVTFIKDVKELPDELRRRMENGK